MSMPIQHIPEVATLVALQGGELWRIAKLIH